MPTGPASGTVEPESPQSRGAVRGSKAEHLQAVFCTPDGCGWKTVDKVDGNYYAGGGSGKRATAHEDCSSTATVGFRSYVDINLIGVQDPPGYTYSTALDLSCYPSS